MYKPIFKEKNLMRRMTLPILGVLVVFSLLLAACAPAVTPTAEPTAEVMEPTAAPMEHCNGCHARADSRGSCDPTIPA
jgi:hypothetical protein